MHQKLKTTNERVDMLDAQMSESIDSQRKELASQREELEAMIWERSVETRQWTEGYIAKVLREQGLGQAYKANGLP
jgi:hypothetical protein